MNKIFLINRYHRPAIDFDDSRWDGTDRWSDWWVSGLRFSSLSVSYTHTHTHSRFVLFRYLCWENAKGSLLIRRELLIRLGVVPGLTVRLCVGFGWSVLPPKRYENDQNYTCTSTVIIQMKHFFFVFFSFFRIGCSFWAKVKICPVE